MWKLVVLFAPGVVLVLALSACKSGTDGEIDRPPQQPTNATTALTPSDQTGTPSLQTTGNEQSALAYVAGTDGALWIRSGDGKLTRLFAPVDGFVYYPEWSPNGEKLAFTEVTFKEPGTGVGYADIFSVVAVDANGNELVRVP